MNERAKGDTLVTGDSFSGGHRSSRFPRGARLFGPLLGLVLLIYPIRAVLQSDPAPARVLLALGGVALFVGVFLWLLWTHEPLQSPAVEFSEVRKRRAAVAFLAVLAVAINFILGSEWRVLFFHTNVAAGLMLLTRDAYASIAGLAVLTLVLGITSGMAWLVLPTVAIGLWATAFVGQVAAVAELRAAREELARVAVGEERLRFARDLHDLLGHSLSLIALKSELAGRLLPEASQKARSEVRDIEGVARRSLREVREAVTGYRQPTLDEELRGAREMLTAAGIACRIENDAGRLQGATDAVLAWAVREGGDERNPPQPRRPMRDPAHARRRTGPRRDNRRRTWFSFRIRPHDRRQRALRPRGACLRLRWRRIQRGAAARGWVQPARKPAAGGRRDLRR